MSLAQALADAFGDAPGARLASRIPAAWESLGPGALVLSASVADGAATVVRAVRGDRWCVSRDPPSDHARDRAAVELAADASRRLAHDLQAPLGAALGRVELADLDHPDLREAASLLHDLGAVQSMRAERFPRRCDHLVDDPDGLHRVAHALQREFARHGFRWGFDPPSEALSALGGDALQSALVILAENALQALQRGGGEARVSLEACEPFVVLRVVDDGPGVEPAWLDSLGLATWRRSPHRASRGLWTLGVIAASLDGAVCLATRASRGTDARVALRLRPLPRASPG
jgi:signal transduction histidine kinase